MKYGRLFSEDELRAALDDATFQRLISKPGTFSDEPHFVLRGKDRAMVGTLASYADRCKALGSPAAHVSACEQFAGEVLAWQAAHFSDVRPAD